MSRPLGATPLLFKVAWLYLQSPCSLLHNDPALGGYTGWSFYEHKAISSPRLLQAWQPGTWGLHNMEYSVFTSDWDEQHGFLQSGSNYMETSLKPSLCSAQDLGATGNMDIREKNLQILSSEQTRLTRCLQQLWLGVGNNYDSVPSIFTNRQFW